LVIQDFARFAALSCRRPAVALISDSVVTFVQLVSVLGLIAANALGTVTLVVAWGIGAQIGAIVALAQLRLKPAITETARWFVRHRSLAVRYGVDDLAAQGSQQGTSFIVAAITGLADAGGLRAAQTVFGPATVVNLGVQTAVTPELVRILSRSASEMRRYANLVGFALAGFAALWGAAAIICPAQIGRELFGESWVTAHPLIVFLAVMQIAASLRVGPLVGLRALGAAERTLRARTIVITLGLLFSFCGAILDGARGVAIAYAIVTPLQSVVWWAQFQAAFKDHRRVRSTKYREMAWQSLLSQAAALGDESRHLPAE
jgi:O-antigen/teichoic acid export membrane protein